MTAFHEIDIALTANVPSPFSAVRLPAAEVHLNPWAAGAKGGTSLTVGTPASVGSVIGIQMVAQRPINQTNAPAELILGDASGAWVINLADGSVVSAPVTNISLIFMP